MFTSGRQAVVAFFLCLNIIILSGCGGGGGGGGERGAPAGGLPAQETASAIKYGNIQGTVMVATADAGRMAPRPADPFLMKIPANQPQSLEYPESGYAVQTGLTVSTTLNSQNVQTAVDNDGTWEISSVPEGAQDFTVSGNGKSATCPMTVKGNTDNKHLALITTDANGNWQCDGQLIHGDGTDGYKKETHSDGTSDTVFEGGTRDHHLAAGDTMRDVTDDGIVDQRFTDTNDDGTPEGEITQVGGDTESDTSQPSAAVNNTPPEITSLNGNNGKGGKTDIVTTGDSLTLELDTSDAEGDSTTVQWTVEDAYGNDVTSLFLDDPNIVAPTFSPPQGEYNKPGAYVVSATVTDVNGGATNKDMIMTVDTPDNKAPHASIKANHTAGDAPLTVDFECRAFDKDGAITSYCWDFDKSNGIDQNDCDDMAQTVTKTFISPGKYRVTCIVTDDKGAVAFDKRVIVVHKKNEPPDITNVTTDKTDVGPGDVVHVGVSATDTDGDAMDIEIIADDGTITDPVPGDGQADWTAPQTPGEYVIEGGATDDDEDSDRDFTQVTVDSPSNKAPSVVATAAPDEGGAPLTVNLTATAQDEDGTIQSVTWDFDDSDGIQTDATGAAATVKYGGPGDFVATVRACDDKGACATDKIKITVTEPQHEPFISDCSAAAASMEAGQNVSLIARATDQDGDALTYSWNVNGGTLSSASDYMPSWSLPEVAGTYTASLTVSDGARTATCDSTLKVIEPEAGGQPHPPAQCAATGGNATALLTWEPSPSDDVEYYRIDRYSVFEAIAAVKDSIAPETSIYSDTGLSNGLVYHYEVVAVDTEGLISDPCIDGMDVTPQPEIWDVVPVGDDPSDAVLDPGTDKIFVPNEQDDTVSVIDAGTDNIIDEIPVGDEPVAVCVNTELHKVYAVNRGDDTVSVINASDNTVSATVAVSNLPNSCVVDEATDDVYVGSDGDDKVDVIDGNTDTVEDNYGGGTDPEVCAVDSAANVLYITSATGGTLTAVNGSTGAVQCSVSVGSGPAGCAINKKPAVTSCPDTIPTEPEMCLTVIDYVCGSNGVTYNSPCGVCNKPGVDWFTKGECGSGGAIGDIYVPLEYEGAVAIVDGATCTMTQKINVGGSPVCTCTVNTITNQIYISNKTKNTIEIFNGAERRLEDSVSVGREPGGTCVDEARDRICAPNRGSDTVTIIDNPAPPSQDTTPPPAPASCSAVGKNAYVEFSWDAVSASDLAGYSVYRALSAGGPFSLLASYLQDTEYTNVDLTNDTRYYYRVVAQDRAGNESTACSDSAVPVEEIIDIIVPPGSGTCCTARDETRNLLFVAHEETNTVEVINQDTYEVIRTINVQNCCDGITVNHVTNKIFVTDKVTNKLTIIDGTNYIIEEIVDLGGGGGGPCVINETTNEIYILNEEENEIIVYNPDTYEKRTVYIGGGGSCPCGLEVDRVTNKVYVTHKETNKLTIIDGTNTIIEEVIDLGGGNGKDCIINEITNTLYITSETTNEVIAFNTKTKKITKRISVGVSPRCAPCAVNTTSNQVYVTNSGSDTISLIDGATNSVAATIAVGNAPMAIASDPVNNNLFVVYGNDSIAVIDNPLPATQSDTSPPASPGGAGASSAQGQITLSWTANTESDLVYYNVYRATDSGGPFTVPATATINNTFTDADVADGTTYYYKISAVDTSSNESGLSSLMSGRPDIPTEVAAGLFPGNVFVDSARDIVFVTNRDSANLMAFSAITRLPLFTASTGVMPWGLDVNAATGNVYVANLGALTLSIINGATGAPVASVPTGGTALASIAVDNINNAYYVSHSNLASGSAVPLNLTTNAPGAAIATRPGSVGIAVNRTTRRIYVANSLDSSVTVINGATNAVVTNIAVDSQPSDVVVNETTNRVYVACAGTGRVIVINGATNAQIAQITVGLETMGLGMDATRNLIYAANSSSGTVSVIDGATNAKLGDIAVDGDPSDVAVHTGQNMLFITLKTAGKLVIRDGF